MVQHTRVYPAAGAVQPVRSRAVQVLGLAALLVTGMALSACNTVAGAGQDVSATGSAVTRGASDVKRGL